jgi:FKBP-type peptidyl-prolyl cis-trans isomerase
MRVLTTILAASVLFLTSCNKYDKAKSGMPYKISGSAKEKFKQGQRVKMHIAFSINVNGKDSSIGNNTFGHIPAYFVIDSTRFGKYNFTDVIFQCGVGNKLDFKLSVDTLKKMGQLDYNKIFKRGSFIQGKVDFLQSFGTDDEMTADYKKEEAAEKQRELKEIDAYVAKKKYKVEKTESGVSVVIENAGEAPKADSGKYLSVYYKGYLVSNEKEFDSNIKDGVKGQALPVTIGSMSVIKGMEDGLKFFGKGGKGKLIIPAMLAYGQQPQGPIPAYANLVFDVEIADLQAAPPAPERMAPPAKDSAVKR